MSAALCAYTAIAAQPDAPTLMNVVTSVAETAPRVAARNASTLVSDRQLAKGVNLEVRRDARGMLHKELTGAKVIAARHALANKAPRKAASADQPINEDFETFDGTADWLPAGWSLRSLTDSASRDSCAAQNMRLGWYVESGSALGGPLDGKADLFISLQFTPIDEWIVLPEIEVKKDFKFSMLYQIDDLFLFNMANLNWDTWTFEGDPQMAYDVRVMVSEDGGQNWEQLKSYYETALASGKTPLDMLDGMGAARTEDLSLAKYEGKKIIIALQYIGVDGQTNTFDNFFVGLPSFDLSYQSPDYVKFLGINTGFAGMNSPITMYPVYEPIVWTNNSPAVEGASYVWNYMDNEGQMQTATGDQLSVTYTPDYSSENTIRSNWFYQPTLVGNAPGYSESTFVSPYKYLQAGGKGQVKSGETIYEMGMLPFCAATEGNTVYRFSQNAPIAGYGSDADSLWTKNLKPGDENGYTHLTHYMNVYASPTSPIVINGIRAMVTGRVSAAAKFTVEIYPSADGAPLLADGTTAKPIAKATANGSDIIETASGSTYNWLCIPFQFLTPVVISDDVTPYYVVRISGFRDPANVEYLASYQSKTPSASNLASGYLQVEVSANGQTAAGYVPVESLTGARQAFCIVEEAEYPWLTSEVDEASLNCETPVSVALGSYYDGSEITVEGAPQWLTASVSGRYNEAVLNLSSTNPDNAEAAITLKAPGVSKTIAVKNVDVASVTDITAPQNYVIGYYDLQGRRVVNPTAGGLYIERRNDGTVNKIVRQ